MKWRQQFFSSFPPKLTYNRSKTAGESYNSILQPVGKMESIYTIGCITGSACHQNIYVKGTNVSELSDLEMATKEIILWRSGLSIMNISATLCFRHLYVLYKRFPTQEKGCCNPFGLHKSAREVADLLLQNIAQPYLLAILFNSRPTVAIATRGNYSLQ